MSKYQPDKKFSNIYFFFLRNTYFNFYKSINVSTTKELDTFL